MLNNERIIDLQSNPVDNSPDNIGGVVHGIKIYGI
jgi:hypothetical protein